MELNKNLFKRRINRVNILEGDDGLLNYLKYKWRRYPEVIELLNKIGNNYAEVKVNIEKISNVPYENKTALYDELDTETIDLVDLVKRIWNNKDEDIENSVFNVMLNNMLVSILEIIAEIND